MCELYNQANDVTDTDNRKRKRRMVQQCVHHEGWKWSEAQGLVLMRKDGRLPEASLDDGGTAELSGLKSTRTAISSVQ